MTMQLWTEQSWFDMVNKFELFDRSPFAKQVSSGDANHDVFENASKKPLVLTAEETALIGDHPIMRYQESSGFVLIGPTTYDIFGLHFSEPVAKLQDCALKYMQTNKTNDPRLEVPYSRLAAAIARSN